MKSPADPARIGSDFKSFTEEIIIYYLGNIDRVQNRDGKEDEQTNTCEQSDL
jgi:hypothetical protein